MFTLNSDQWHINGWIFRSWSKAAEHTATNRTHSACYAGFQVPSLLLPGPPCRARTLPSRTCYRQPRVQCNSLDIQSYTCVSIVARRILPSTAVWPSGPERRRRDQRQANQTWLCDCYVWGGDLCGSSMPVHHFDYPSPSPLNQHLQLPQHAPQVAPQVAPVENAGAHLSSAWEQKSSRCKSCWSNHDSVCCELPQARLRAGSPSSRPIMALGVPLGYRFVLSGPCPRRTREGLQLVMTRLFWLAWMPCSIPRRLDYNET